MTDRFVVVPAAYVYLLRPAPMPGGREVLLGLRHGTGYRDGHWAAVAGHVERGESVFEAARREALEEVGVTDVRLEPWCAMQRTGAGDPVDERVDYFFTSTSWSGVPRILEPSKCADLRWFNLAGLPSPVVPHELRVLRSITAGSTPPFVAEGF
jgi:8-oxo-dGTP pyrophosphatase MutT (NUDIX family)